MFVGTLDQTVVVTILPKIIDGIELPVSKFGQATWIVNGYLLGYTIAMPVVGRLGDMYGHVRIYVVCLAVLMIGSGAVAVAPNLELLVAARAVQAIGGGGVLPLAMAIAAEAVPRGRRALMLGGLAATNNASSLLGPLWGAALVGVAGWRGVFWLNIPLILPIAIALPLLVGRVRTMELEGTDWRGSLLLVAALAAATLALTDDGANPRPLAVSIAIGCLAALLLAWLIRVELRIDRPTIPLDSFRDLHFAAAMVMYFLIGGALIVALVDVPLMANLLFQSTALEGGLDLMRLLLLLPLGGVAGGLACNRIGRRPAAAAGIIMAIMGFMLMRAWPASPTSLDLWLALGSIGFGLGLCDAPIVSTVVDAVRRPERATASALLLVLWTSGMIAGLALLGTQGLGSFSTRAARLFREQGTSLDLGAVQQIIRQTFNATILGAIVALLLALALARLLEGGRSRSLRWNPLVAGEE
ncbi:MAG TPA: MFS transporter [Dehalococcoidia bacterium]|nr:MFS transporter [Dehalococcoidia bacterium]